MQVMGSGSSTLFSPSRKIRAKWKEVGLAPKVIRGPENKKKLERNGVFSLEKRKQRR